MRSLPSSCTSGRRAARGAPALALLARTEISRPFSSTISIPTSMSSPSTWRASSRARIWTLRSERPIRSRGACRSGGSGVPADLRAARDGVRGARPRGAAGRVPSALSGAGCTFVMSVRSFLSLGLVVACAAMGAACDEQGSDPSPGPGEPGYVRDPALEIEIELVSDVGSAESHEVGANCMACHQALGPGPGRFSAAGGSPTRTRWSSCVRPSTVRWSR